MGPRAISFDCIKSVTMREGRKRRMREREREKQTDRADVVIKKRFNSSVAAGRLVCETLLIRVLEDAINKPVIRV